MVDSHGIIRTVAGTGQPGHAGDGGPAIRAEVDDPNRLAFDAHGNLFVEDSDGNLVRMIDRRGIISTVAGTGHAGFSGDGGAATKARLNQPGGSRSMRQGDCSSRIRELPDPHGRSQGRHLDVRAAVGGRLHSSWGGVSDSAAARGRRTRRSDELKASADRRAGASKKSSPRQLTHQRPGGGS